jgi:hypothetical protein
VCEALLLIIWEHKLSILAYALKGGEVTGRYRKLHEEELHNLLQQT